jgi:hypothetical protein
MATRVWGGGSNNPPIGPLFIATWNIAGNWTGDTVPEAGDDVIFDGTAANEDCSLDVDTALLGSFEIRATYLADFWQSTENKDLNVAGNATFAGSGAFRGSQASGSLINIGGDWDYSAQNIWTTESGNVHLTGSGNLIPPASVKYIRSITVDAGANYTYDSGGDQIWIRGAVSGSFQFLKVEGTLTIATGKTIGAGNSMNLYVSATGTLTGAGTVNPQAWLGPRWCQIATGGTCDIDNLDLGVSSSNLLVQGQIDSANVTYSGNGSVVQYDGVTYTGDVTIEEGGTGQVLTFLNTTENPDMTFQGDVIVDDTGDGTIVWTPGTGTINLTGTADQSINFDCQTTEDIVINKSSGTVTLANCLDAESLTHSDGALDTNNKDVTTTDNLTISAGATVTGSNLDGTTWTVGGDLDISGTDEDTFLDLVAGASWDLDVTGTATAKWVDVAYSDASGGSEVEGLAGTDSGNNVNWAFTGITPISTRGGITVNHGIQPIVRQNSALSGELTKSDRLTGDFTKEDRLTGSLAASDYLTGEFTKEGQLTANLAAKDRLTGDIEHE